MKQPNKPRTIPSCCSKCEFDADFMAQGQIQKMVLRILSSCVNIETSDMDYGRSVYWFGLRLRTVRILVRRPTLKKKFDKKFKIRLFGSLKNYWKKGCLFERIGILSVVQTKAVLILKSLSERDGSDMERL